MMLFEVGHDDKGQILRHDNTFYLTSCILISFHIILDVLEPFCCVFIIFFLFGKSSLDVGTYCMFEEVLRVLPNTCLGGRVSSEKKMSQGTLQHCVTRAPLAPLSSFPHHYIIICRNVNVGRYKHNVLSIMIWKTISPCVFYSVSILGKIESRYYRRGKYNNDKMLV